MEPFEYLDPLLHMGSQLACDQNTGLFMWPHLEVILPSVELVGVPPDGEVIMRHLEGAIRTAYKSEDKIGPGSAEKILKHILSLKHESTLEHVNLTFRIVTSRGVTHELVRHRIASYTQESTRYVNYGKRPPQVILPWHLTKRTSQEKLFWYESQQKIISYYQDAIRILNWKPQDARGLLPNDLKTEIVMTMNLRSLRNFLILRTAASAHPDMQVVAREILNLVYHIVPLIFEDIQHKIVSNIV